MTFEEFNSAWDRFGAALKAWVEASRARRCNQFGKELLRDLEYGRGS